MIEGRWELACPETLVTADLPTNGAVQGQAVVISQSESEFRSKKAGMQRHRTWDSHYAVKGYGISTIVFVIRIYRSRIRQKICIVDQLRKTIAADGDG